MDEAVIAIFFLMLMLILVVYYIGTTNLAASFTSTGVQLIYWLTGRDAQGHFVTQAAS